MHANCVRLIGLALHEGTVVNCVLWHHLLQDVSVSYLCIFCFTLFMIFDLLC
jgi:hypothetical protein